MMDGFESLLETELTGPWDGPRVEGEGGRCAESGPALAWAVWCKEGPFTKMMGKQVWRIESPILISKSDMLVRYQVTWESLELNTGVQERCAAEKIRSHQLILGNGGAKSSFRNEDPEPRPEKRGTEGSGRASSRGAHSGLQGRSVLIILKCPH
jgi:hypothetical protein